MFVEKYIDWRGKMKQLIIFARPGIAVVSGVVRYAEHGKVLVENNVYLPVSKKMELRQMEISFPESKLTRMRLKPGNFVLATIKDNDPALDEVIHGGEVPDKVFHVTGYNIRYSGSFDFDAYSEYDETHVFSGSVKDLIKNDRGDVNFKLNCWKNSQAVDYLIYLPAKKAQGITTGKKIIVVTGPMFSNGLYAARRVVDF